MDHPHEGGATEKHAPESNMNIGEPPTRFHQRAQDRPISEPSEVLQEPSPTQPQPRAHNQTDSTARSQTTDAQRASLGPPDAAKSSDTLAQVSTLDPQRKRRLEVPSEQARSWNAERTPNNPPEGSSTGAKLSSRVKSKLKGLFKRDLGEIEETSPIRTTHWTDE